MDYQLCGRLLESVVNHPTRGALASDLSANSFMVVVCEKVLCKFSQNFLSKARLKHSHR